MTTPDPQRLSIDRGWLVYDTGHHTCGTGPDGHYGAHEPGCGLEPLMTVEELSTILDTLAAQGVPINRPALAVAAAERRGAAAALAPFDALFNGGPDTSCRTTWRRALPGPGIHRPPSTECVEVPMDDLRDAFDQAEAATVTPAEEPTP